MFSVIIYAILAGLGIVIVSAPLGCFMIWRRMSYLGDTLAHSALLGVAMGVILDIDINTAIFIGVLLISYLLMMLQKNLQTASDTILSILANSSLAIGIVLISTTSVRVDIMSYLFGDILSINEIDLIIIYTSSLLILTLIYFLWHPLLATIIHSEMAKIDGINTSKIELLLTFITAMVIACNMKIVGVLLVTAILIIPAASAQGFAKTPVQMVIMAGFFGLASVMLGLLISWVVDSPSGPSIVLASFCLFLSTRPIIKLIHKKNQVIHKQVTNENTYFQ